MEIRNQPNRPQLPKSDITKPNREGLDENPPTKGTERSEEQSARSLGRRIRNVRAGVQRQEQTGQRANEARSLETEGNAAQRPQDVRKRIAQQSAQRAEDGRESARAQRVQNARGADKRADTARTASARSENARADELELSSSGRALAEGSVATDKSRQEVVEALTRQFQEGRLVTTERVESAARRMLESP